MSKLKYTACQRVTFTVDGLNVLNGIIDTGLEGTPVMPTPPYCNTYSIEDENGVMYSRVPERCIKARGYDTPHEPEESEATTCFRTDQMARARQMEKGGQS